MGTEIEAVIDILPHRPVDVAQGCKAIRNDASVIAGELEKFVKGRGGVPDFHSHAVVLRYIAMTAESCRLMMQEEQLACRISMLARFRRVWPLIKGHIRYIVRGH